MGALPYTLALLVPAIAAQLLGREQGRRARRAPQGRSTTRCCRSATSLTATPQMWLGIVLVWVFASHARRSSRSPAPTASTLQPAWSLEFAGSFLYHWILPFSALFLVAFGGWAIGMRNMIIYELEADYSNYLAALGAPTKLVRKYAYRNALLPQITGLALALGAVVAGAIVVEIVFSYPGPRHADAVGDPEPRLLPDPGHLPLPDHRRPDRELHHRHRLRLHRPAHAGRDAGRSLMARLEPTRGRRRARAAARRRRRDAAPRRHAAGAGAPPRAAPSSSTSRCRNWKFVFGVGLVLALLALAIVGPMLDRPRAARVHRPDRPAAVVRVLVRHDLVRPGRLRAVRPRPARGVPRRRRRRRDRVADRRGRRLHGRLPRRLGRRRPEHAHERRARDPDARDPDHRRRVPERAQLRDRGDPHRAHLVAVGGARGPRADVLAEDARLRRHRAPQRPQHAADHRDARSRRT